MATSTIVRVIPEEIVPGKRLGRHIRHDPRSLLYRVARQPARTLVSVRHDRAIPVFDQGELGSCTGNAAVGAVGTAPLFAGLPVGHVTLDEVEAVRIYSASTKLDAERGTYPPTDTGSDGLSAAKTLRKHGFIPGYLHATSIPTMQYALLDTPVIVGVPWYSSFDSPSSSGLVTISAGAEVRGGHEFEVLGMDVTDGTFLAVNSWGTGYGVNGLFSFTFDTMARLLAEDGDCTQLLPLTVPAPTPAPPPAGSDLATWWAKVKPWAEAPHLFHLATTAARATNDYAARSGLS